MDEKPTYEKLLSDNREMSKSLHWYRQDTKVNNFIRSILFAIIVCVTIAIIELFAVIGANAFAEKQNLSFFWISTIGAFLDISHWILYGYVIWHVFTVNFYNFYDARGRTKNDIAVVRHLYLDLDRNGLQSLKAIRDDARLPSPSYILNTSEGKYQVIWKVIGHDMERAEKLQRAMALEHGADRAATDVTRVLRIPGFLQSEV